jgi:hypothetical protein
VSLGTATEVEIKRRKKDPAANPIHWKAGSRFGKLDAEKVMKDVRKLEEPSPENLYEASRAKKHSLHALIWSEDDAEWAHRGRVERCREVLRGLVETMVIGGATIEVRACEWVRPESRPDGVWGTIDQIVLDADLRDAYLAEAEQLLLGATAKLRKVRQVLSASA